MADEEAGKGDSEEKKGSAEFDPKSLGADAQEYIRRKTQSDSDTKTAVVEKRLRDEQAQRARTAVETAEQNELRQLAASGQNEALGVRVAARMTQQTAEAQAIGRASDVIERQMSEKFSETLGPEKVEEVRQQVLKEGGAHAEFAAGLAKAVGGKAQTEEIQAEVKAQLAEARGEKRDAEPGPGKAAGTGQGQPPEGFDAIQKDYIAGKLGPTPEANRKAYEKALEARGK